MLDLKINEFGYTEQNIIFKNIQYHINDKKCIISGSNGSGKTSLSLILAGIIPRLHKCFFDGSLDYNNKIVELDTIKSKFHYQFQNPSFNFLSLKVSDILSEKEFRESFYRLFPNNLFHYEQSLAYLSTGQKQQLAFYDAMKSSKEVIYFDEPFSFLDSKSIDNSISLLNSTHDKSFIIINHIRSLTKIIENCYEIILGDNNDYNPIFFDKNKHITNESLFQIHFSNFHFPWHKINVPDEIIIHKGEIVGISGDNGTGKTTLSRELAGLVNYKISVSYQGKHINQSKKRKLIKLAFQDVDFQIYQNDIRKELFAILNTHYDRENVEKKIDEFYKYFFHIKETDPFKLSYGQRKLFIILQIYLLEPELLILDEPFSSLDTENNVILNKLIENHLSKGKAIILTSHDNKILELYCNKIINL